MSVMGPRAYLPSELNVMGDYALTILRIKPGLTGWWQVMGRHRPDRVVGMDRITHFLLCELQVLVIPAEGRGDVFLPKFFATPSKTHLLLFSHNSVYSAPPTGYCANM
ncbi:hypothetical protein D4S03_02855 [bacterium]|nr:MAG: hypothetical protein D4S03_02855 [bacterium]